MSRLGQEIDAGIAQREQVAAWLRGAFGDGNDYTEEDWLVFASDVIAEADAYSPCEACRRRQAEAESDA